MLANTLHHSMELENSQNDCLNGLFLGSFASARRLYTTCVYKSKMTTKVNQNGIVKPIVSPLHVVQSINKIERHGYIRALHRTSCLQFYPWQHGTVIFYGLDNSMINATFRIVSVTFFSWIFLVDSLATCEKMKRTFWIWLICNMQFGLLSHGAVALHCSRPFY